MLVSAKEMLQKAKAGHYAVGQFNINNLEWTKAILATAQECNSPVILGVSEGAGKYMTGYGTVVGMVKAMMEEMNITVPVALHLDHGSLRRMPDNVHQRQVSPPSCSTVLIIRSKRTLQKTKELVTDLRRARECLWRQRLVPSAARKTALSVWVSAQTRTSAR